MSQQANFPIDPTLTGITIAYKNKKLIADEVLPRKTPTATETFRYNVARLADGYSVPDTKVGRKGVPNEIEAASVGQTGATADYGLDSVVPNSDIENGAKVGVDPLAVATTQVTDIVMLDREIRTAGIVFNAATYPANNKTVLSGTSQWSDFANSNPISAILNAIDSMIMRPNTMTVGRRVWTSLSQHPKICKAIFGNNTDAGIVSREQFAALFELDNVLVGEGFVNNARPGQPVSMARVWGLHAALTVINPLAERESGVTFGMTVPFGTRIATQIPEPKVGLRGAVRVRVGESLSEIITAPDAGYFFQNAVAF